MQRAHAVESVIELVDLLEADTSVLGEQLEGLRVLVEGLQVDDVLVHGVQSLIGRSRSKEHGSIAAGDSVLSLGRFVIGCALYHWDFANGEGYEQIFRWCIHSGGVGRAREISSRFGLGLPLELNLLRSLLGFLCGVLLLSWLIRVLLALSLLGKFSLKGQL